MDGNTGNVYPKHQPQQRQQNTNKLEKIQKIQKSVNQFKKNYCGTKQLGKKKTKKTKK